MHTTETTIEQALEKVRQIVAGFNPNKGSEQLKTMRALMTAVGNCKKYIEDNSATDRGCAQRIVRELHEVLSTLPMFRGLAADKGSVHNLHTRKLAEGQLDSIYDQLRDLVKELEQGKQEVIHDWVKTHPVFSQLKSLLNTSLPKTAYILLFRLSEDGHPELITNRAADGRIFTRLRPEELKDDLHVHKLYRGKRAVVGAAAIAEKELIAVIGDVPQPDQSKDQLKALLSASSEAAGRPAREFIEANAVLNALHEMSRHRDFPRESYVLLFEEDRAAYRTDEEPLADDRLTSVETHPDMAQNHDQDAGPDPDLVHAPSPQSVDDQSQEPVEDQRQESVDDQSQEPVEDPSQEPAQYQGQQSPMSDAQVEIAPSVEPAAIQLQAPLKIVVKSSQDGKVISRFWPSDFAQRYKLFESFKNKPLILGAAVIKEGQLLRVLGQVPAPQGLQSQLEALLQVSFAAVEKPHVEFIEQHEVLRGLHALAMGEMASKPVDVVLFTVADNGKVEVMPVGGQGGRPQARLSLGQFQNAKLVHDRFGKRNIVGASVISQSAPPVAHERRFPPKGAEGDRGKLGRDSQQSGPKPVVLAAFGRTPLKVNIIATPETLRRLGIELDEPQPRSRPPRRHN